MTHILHAIDTTGPGGAETVFIELLSRLDSSQYKPTVVIRGPGWVQDELRRRGIEPHIVPAKGSFNLRYLRGLVHIIRRERIDVIQSHLLGSNVYCCLAGFLTRTPVIATFHGAADIQGDRFLQQKFALINAIASRTVLVSETLKRQLAAHVRLHPKKTQVIYNGIAADSFQKPPSTALRSELGLSEEAIVVGAIGNIRQPKGYDILLHAAARVTQQNPSVHFAIAGHEKQPLYNELLSLRAKLGLEAKVHFLGFRPDAAALLSNFDAYVLSSTSEGFSISTIEAMAAGLPVVVTKSGGPEEIVTDGHDGLMVPAGSSDALAQAILRLTEDKALCQRLATQARHTVQARFTIDKMLAAYTSLYQAALSRR